MGMIRKCIEEDECEVTLYSIDGCGGCEHIEEVLDEMNIPYEKKEATVQLCKRTGLNSVPQVVIETPGATYVVQDSKKLRELLD